MALFSGVALVEVEPNRAHKPFPGAAVGITRYFGDTPALQYYGYYGY